MKVIEIVIWFKKLFPPPIYHAYIILLCEINLFFLDILVMHASHVCYIWASPFE